MRFTLCLTLVFAILSFSITAIAADQTQTPNILASLDNSDGVIYLDDKSMAQIEGTFCFPCGHPSLRESLRIWFRSSFCEKIGIIKAHLGYRR